MPEMASPSSPQPQPGAQGQQGQSPFGSSPATQPTQNAGQSEAGKKMVGMVLMLMENAVPLVGSNSPMGQDLVQSIQKLGKHVPPGTVQPQDIVNVAKSIMMKAQQGQQQMQQMRQQQAQPGAGAAGGGQPMQPRAA